MIAGALVVAALVAVSMALPASAIEVDTAAVARGAMRVTVDEEGRTRLRDRYIVAAPVAGRIERLAVKEGDRVTAGQEIWRASSPRRPIRGPWPSRAASWRQPRPSAPRPRSRVQNATATTEQRQRDFDRAASLAEGGALSRQALEQARLAATEADQQLAMQRSALEAADAEVAAARAALIGLAPGQSGGSAVPVRAPTAGRVLRRRSAERPGRAGWCPPGRDWRCCGPRGGRGRAVRGRRAHRRRHTRC